MQADTESVPFWAVEFRPGSTLHIASVVVWGTVIGVLVVFGRRHRSSLTEARWRRGAAWALVGFVFAYNLYYLWPSNFDVKVSLPIQVCDIALLAAPVALGWQARWARVLLYFWGLLLSVQGFLFPTLQSGPAAARYWCFWISHAAIVGVALYDLAVLGYRPTWRDLRTAWMASLLYVACVSAINVSFSLNYGFIGNDLPDNPTPLHSLGPWPLRAVWIVLIALAAQSVAWLAWPLMSVLRDMR
jgi:hypothetical integral membrane protein (TIGR02206 family)